jgi:hypothetical protein
LVAAATIAQAELSLARNMGDYEGRSRVEIVNIIIFLSSREPQVLFDGVGSVVSESGRK